MAITISGENNNDRILAADGVIDQISGINIVGLITASHINVGSNIQLGNAGIITATTFVGNVTGNVNSTSPLLLQTGGSERFRITGNNELGIAGANYGTAGQVLTSGGSGSAVSWTTIPTQVSISNNADNRIITGGSGTNLVGESTLTYDGNDLTQTTNANGEGIKINGGNNSSSLTFNANRGTQAVLGVVYGRWNSTTVAQMSFVTGDDGTDKNDGYITFGTESAASNGNVNAAERLRITQTGKLGINHSSPVTIIHAVGNNTVGTSVTMTLQSHDTANATAGIDLLARNSSNVNQTSKILATSGGTNNVDLTFHTNNTERLRITSTGQLLLMSNTGYNPSSSLLSLATDASAAANMLSDSSSIYNHNNPAFVHVQNMNNTGDGQEAGIILHSKSSFGGAWAIYGKRTTSGFKSDLIFRGRTGSSSSAERLRITSDGVVQIDQGTAGGNHFKIVNDEISLLQGVNGTGDTYAREAFIGCTRVDSGSYPFLRIAGQNGIKLCVDANSERARIESDGDFRLSSDSAETNYGWIRGWQSSTGDMIISADHSATGTGTSKSNLIFRSRGSEKFRLDSSGSVLFSGLTAKNDPRNAAGIAIKSANGISFQNYGANGSHNWRIRPDDMIGWGTLEFAVSPTSNSSTDWPDHADDVVLCLKPEKNVVVPNGRLGVGLNGTPSATFEVVDSTGGDYSHTKQGWARKRTFSVPIINNQQRWYKLVNYQAGNMLVGRLEIYTARGGGFNQTKGYNEWRVSYGGHSNNIYGTSAENTSFQSGTGNSVDLVIGTDGVSTQNLYIKVPGSIYGGRVFFIFEGLYANWQWDESTYLTSAP